METQGTLPTEGSNRPGSIIMAIIATNQRIGSRGQGGVTARHPLTGNNLHAKKQQQQYRPAYCHDVSPAVVAGGALADVTVAACDTSVAKNVWTSSGFLREKEAFVSGGRSGSNFSFTRMPMPPQALHQRGGGGVPQYAEAA